MTWSKLRLIIPVFLPLFILSGCGPSANPIKKQMIETTDMSGRKVMIPEKVERIVALNPGMLRLIAWLDATDMVCGIEYNETRRIAPYLFAHPELREKNVIGTGNAPDPELLAALAPDIIFSTYITRAEADIMQSRTGIPVLAIQYGNFDNEIDTVYQALKYLGKILHREKRAEYLTGYIQETIRDLNARTSGVTQSKNPRVYVGGISYRGSHGITSTEPRYPPFRFLNTANVASSLGLVMTSQKDNLQNAFIDKEQLIEWDPDFIFLDMSSNTYKNGLMDEPWIDVLKATKNGQIFTVYPYNWYTINYSTILVNAYFIGRTLYPDNFMDVKTEEKADEIYRAILGKPVYNDMLSHFGEFTNLK